MDALMIGAVVVLGAFGLVAYVVRCFERASASYARASEAMTRSLAQVKGLHPHHAAPDTFSSQGVTFEELQDNQEQVEHLQNMAERERDEEELERIRDAEAHLAGKGEGLSSDLEKMRDVLMERLRN